MSQRTEQFQNELTRLINQFGIDADTETPDYILADSIMRHIDDTGKTRKAIRSHFTGEAIKTNSRNKSPVCGLRSPS